MKSRRCSDIIEPPDARDSVSTLRKRLRHVKANGPLQLDARELVDADVANVDAQRRELAVHPLENVLVDG